MVVGALLEDGGGRYLELAASGKYQHPAIAALMPRVIDRVLGSRHAPSIAIDGDIAILRLVPRDGGRLVTRIRIDTKRAVVLDIATLDGEKTTNATYFPFAPS